MALDLLLRILDGARDPSVLDGLIVLESHALHPADDFIRAKNPEEVILETKEEATRAWVTLATCATTKLIVDSTRLVPLCTDDAKSAEVENLLPSANSSG